MTMRRVKVAIDGPAGAGKSTVAQRVAAKLGYLLLDTGAIYRAVALASQQESIAWEDEDRVAALAMQLIQIGAIRLESVKLADAVVTRVFLHGSDVSDAIRAPAISMGASRVSAIAGVRSALLDFQRKEGHHGGVVLEGRDIGTVVFPDAEVKFFLSASPEVRAQRRYQELVSRGNMNTTYEATLEDVIRRDKADTERPIAPLKCADDAIVVDSSDRSVDEIVNEMVRIVEKSEHS